jgi:probable HAF family extracellular repeat protein
VAVGINSRGETVGFDDESNRERGRAFTYFKGKLADLNDLSPTDIG